MLSGRIGMREDKSMDAEVQVTEMSIEKILPENLRPLIHGKISGKLNWHRDTSGVEVSSEGDLKLTGASISNLSVFKELTDLHNNPDLQISHSTRRVATTGWKGAVFRSICTRARRGNST